MDGERSLLKRGTMVRKADYATPGLNLMNAAGREEEEEAKRRGFLPPIATAASDSDDDAPGLLLDLHEILDAILHPKELTVAGEAWVQPASASPATRVDVVQLQRQADRLLDDRKAKDFGLCPVRRQIYDQLFEELLRQVTIECAERGLLLMRVRDELRLTVATYQGLYESAVSFGIRKALGAEERRSDAETENGRLRQERADTDAKITELERALREQRRSLEQQNTTLGDRLLAENERLKAANLQLQEQIIELVKPPEDDIVA